MLALYAFCRTLDDACDEPNGDFIFWRAEAIRLCAGIPRHPLTREMQRALRRFGIAREDISALLEGFAMDQRGIMHRPALPELLRYCDGVAGSPGLMTLAILGVPRRVGEAYALHLGRALQLTNILRDTADDLRAGRIYYPLEWLATAGLSGASPQALLHAPYALTPLRRKMGMLALAHYRQADLHLPAIHKERLRVARAMRDAYFRQWRVMARHGWAVLERERVKSPTWVKKPDKPVASWYAA